MPAACFHTWCLAAQLGFAERKLIAEGVDVTCICLFYLSMSSLLGAVGGVSGVSLKLHLRLHAHVFSLSLLLQLLLQLSHVQDPATLQ